MATISRFKYETIKKSKQQEKETVQVEPKKKKEVEAPLNEKGQLRNVGQVKRSFDSMKLMVVLTVSLLIAEVSSCAKLFVLIEILIESYKMCLNP